MGVTWGDGPAGGPCRRCPGGGLGYACGAAAHMLSLARLAARLLAYAVRR